MSSSLTAAVGTGADGCGEVCRSACASRMVDQYAATARKSTCHNMCQRPSASSLFTGQPSQSSAAVVCMSHLTMAVTHGREHGITL